MNPTLRAIIEALRRRANADDLPRIWKHLEAVTGNPRVTLAEFALERPDDPALERILAALVDGGMALLEVAPAGVPDGPADTLEQGPAQAQDGAPRPADPAPTPQ